MSVYTQLLELSDAEFDAFGLAVDAHTGGPVDVPLPRPRSPRTRRGIDRPVGPGTPPAAGRDNRKAPHGRGFTTSG
jgi:hypothetical protein